VNDFQYEALRRRQNISGQNIEPFDKVNPTFDAGGGLMGGMGEVDAASATMRTKKPVEQKMNYPKVDMKPEYVGVPTTLSKGAR